MTTLTAAQRRAILANAHAKYYYCPIPAGRDAVFEELLRAADVIPSALKVTEITQEGMTTLLIKLSDGSAILLDAYGNMQRGML